MSTQKLIEAALAYGRAHAAYQRAWRAWEAAYPKEYLAHRNEGAPRPAFDRDVLPPLNASLDARYRLEEAADELYAGSAGILALADEATAREPQDDAAPGPSLADAIHGGGC